MFLCLYVSVVVSLCICLLPTCLYLSVCLYSCVCVFLYLRVFLYLCLYLFICLSVSVLVCVCLYLYGPSQVMLSSEPSCQGEGGKGAQGGKWGVGDIQTSWPSCTPDPQQGAAVLGCPHHGCLGPRHGLALWGHGPPGQLGSPFRHARA